MPSAQIDEEALPEERENLLAVTQVLASLRYNEAWTVPAPGRAKGHDRITCTSRTQGGVDPRSGCRSGRSAIVDFLVARFGPQAEEIATQFESIADDARLKDLVKFARRLPRPPILSEGTRGLT